ncbi:hypothetical protein ABZP36_008045 [Zizania latifolia]
MNAASPPAAPLSSSHPEQVIAVHLQCYAQTPGDHHQEQPPLKLTVLFIPHDAPGAEEEDGVKRARSSTYVGGDRQQRYVAFEVIDEKEKLEQRGGAGACLKPRDVDERLLPKAMDHLRRNTASRMYQVCLRSSSHGAAHFCVEKTTASELCGSAGTRRSRSRTSATTAARRRRETAEERRERYSIEGWQESARELLKLWVVRASDRLHGSISSWTTDTILSN